MQRHKKLSARILSMALSVAMVATMMPATVFAAEGGSVALGASSIGTIQSFEKLEDRFVPSTGEGASKDVYALNVKLNTPFEDLNLPDELTAMVARTTTVSAPAEDEPVVDSGKPSEPAVDEVIPDEDKVVEGDTATDDTVSGNQPASPSDAEENPEIPDEDVPLAPEPEQDKETTVTTTEQETLSVTWNSDKEYVSDENGKFVYTAELPEGYILADGAKLPQIYVFVGKQARAASGGEQFNLPLGDTYYFDLSGEAGTITSGVSDKIGTINTSLPDATMHYVPFTYVGTVNAYSLDSSSSGQTGASAAATASDRSLFVADYNVSTTTISWDSLNTNELVFGKTFDTNYKLRSLSVGSSEENSQGSPSTNEWDTILDKTTVTNPIKNWMGIASWGQDTFLVDTAIRAALRGHASARKWVQNYTSVPASIIGYRPALEVLNVDSLNAVELDWNGGKFNNSTSSIKIVCAGGTFIAPGSTGLTAPTDKTAKATFWNTAADGSGTSYAAGASVPNSVTKLYAQWEDSGSTNSTITPTTATFDKYTSAAGYADVAVTQTLNGNTLTAIKNGSATLTSSTDYTVSGNTITIKKEYLAQQGVGTTTLTFDYSAGTDPTMAITVSDSTPATTYTVSFNANGGMGGTLPSTITQSSAGASVTIPAPSAASGGTKSGFTLDTTKWATTAGGTTYVNSGSYTPTANITLYAVWTFNTPTAPTITTTTLPGGTVGTAYNQTLAATGSTPITWSIDSGSLPAGLTLNGSTGVISGTPTTEGTASFTVKASNSTSPDATKALSIAINATPTTHTITASADMGGSITPSGTVTVNNGESKTFTISANGNYSIASVTVDGVNQGAISTYTFSNVTGNHTISATFSYNGGGGSSSGGGSSTPPAKPTEPVKGESNTTATVDKNGNATTTVTDKNIADAVKAAKDAANKKGVNAGEITAVINVTAPANSNPNTVTVNLPKTVQQQVINNKIDNVAIVIDKPDISIGMNLATITEMNKQANADIALSATRIDATKLSREAKNAIGSRPAFDLKATYNSGTKSITSFGSGSVSVAIPYTLQKGEVAGGLYAVYIDGSGKANYITGSSYDADAKMLRFATNHFSVYGIGYKAPSAFTDIAGHWAKTDIEFVANRGLMSGTSNTTFAPNGSMTRGMFVTALGRLAGVDVNSYKTGKFTDVKADAYYAPYVNWAAEKGITNGTTATTFSPDSTVTRQEMAVFMSNYAKAMGYKVPETREAVTFADNGSIGSWAAAAVKQMQMAGVQNGKNGNKFDPTGTATRAEVAAVLHRYVALVIDRSTAQGLDTNDSGSAMMYENGKAVKSASRTVGSATYNFNANGEAALLPADN